MNVDEALDRYEEHFGCPYPLCITDCRPEQEIVTEILACILDDKKAPEPSYKADCVY